MFNNYFEQYLNKFPDSISNIITNISKKASNIDYEEKLRNISKLKKKKLRILKHLKDL